MSRLTILHTNDIHGRVEGLSRVGTLVSRIRDENRSAPVLFFDLGDSEEYSNRLSSLTKGVAMHRLLEAAGCDATVVGNAILSRYGPKIVTKEAQSTIYPHLVANAHFGDGRHIAGTEPTIIIQAGEVTLGLIGVTAPNDNYELFFGLRVVPPIPVIRELIEELRDAGVDAVILLSHLGIDADREVAKAFQGDLNLILGGHSHTVLPEGERIGDVLIAQAGEYARHLGRVELDWDGSKVRVIEASVVPVTASLQPSTAVQTTIKLIEKELQEFLDEVICDLPHALDFALDRECGMGNVMADALRHRTDVDIALAIPGPKFIGGLPSGPLQRGTLWDICPSTGNPRVVIMPGTQLSALVQRGLDAEFAADKHPALRGHGRGLMHVSGAVVRNNELLIAGQLLMPERHYRVAACDFEFEPVWGYTDQSWRLKPEYEVDVIVREVFDDYFRAVTLSEVSMGRLGGTPGDSP